jgi:hypothetical protein
MDETTYLDLLHSYSRSAHPICKHQIMFWFTPPLTQGFRQLRKSTLFGNLAYINVQKSVVITSSHYGSIDHFINGTFEFLTFCIRSRDSVVCIASSYGLDDRGVGVRVPVGSRIFFSPNRPDRLWGPPNLLFNGYRGSFPGGKAAGAWSWPLTSN